jgi:hypothetical protein
MATPPLDSEHEDKWTPQPVWTVEKRKISCPCWLFSSILITVLTELSWLFACISVLIESISSYREQAEVPVLWPEYGHFFNITEHRS